MQTQALDVRNEFQGFGEFGKLIVGQAQRIALTQLSKRLLACGIVPYYLHMLDRVAGSAHFEVAVDKAAALLRELHHCLPGYLVPRLAKEEPGQPAKTLLSW